MSSPGSDEKKPVLQLIRWLGTQWKLRLFSWDSGSLISQPWWEQGFTFSLIFVNKAGREIIPEGAMAL